VRATLLFLAVYSVSTAAIVLLKVLPETPLFRYAVFLIPAIVGLVVVAEWVERTTPQEASAPLQDFSPGAITTRDDLAA
jgi:hypothetical protein